MKRIWFHKHEKEKDIGDALLREESKQVIRDKHNRIRRLLSKEPELAKIISWYLKADWENGEWVFRYASKVVVGEATITEGKRSLCNLCGGYNVLDDTNSWREEGGEPVFESPITLNHLLRIWSGEVEAPDVIGLFEDNTNFFKEIGVAKPPKPYRAKKVVSSAATLYDLSLETPTYSVDQEIDMSEVERCLKEIKEPGDVIEKPHPLFSYWLRRTLADELGSRDVKGERDKLTAYHVQDIGLFGGVWYVGIDIRLDLHVRVDGSLEDKLRYFLQHIRNEFDTWGYDDTARYLLKDGFIREVPETFFRLYFPLKGYRERMVDTFYVRKKMLKDVNRGTNIGTHGFYITKNKELDKSVHHAFAIGGFRASNVRMTRRIRLSHEARPIAENRDLKEKEKQDLLNKLWK